MATSKTSPAQDVLVDPAAFLADGSNDDVFGDSKTDAKATTAAQIAARPGKLWGNGVDDNFLSIVAALDTRATTATTDATVTTIATVQTFAGADAVVLEDEMWRIEVTLYGIEGADSAQTLSQRTVWNVFGRGGPIATAVVVENDGPNIFGANLAGTPGLTIDTTGQKMILKVTGLAATTINWEILYTQRTLNKQ